MADYFSKNIINKDASFKEGLAQLNKVPDTLTLFVVDDEKRLVGTLTDGDIRRGLLRDVPVSAKVEQFMFTNFKYLNGDDYSLEQVQLLKKQEIKLLPILDKDRRIIRIVELAKKKSLLPLDAVIMAGGKGTRLRPLTLTTPKPLLQVGNKPIIEYNVDRLNTFGVYHLHISVNYLGQQIKDYFGNGHSKNMKIQYVEENEPLGTIGALSLIENFQNDYILVMNSDLLTNIDYENMFRHLIHNEADMVVATTPYEVKIPYGIVETDEERIIGLKEKPTYTYYSNAGIYIFKKEHLPHIPINTNFNATDLMEVLFSNNMKVLHYPILGYWLDIGKPQDFEKAQKDIHHIQF